MSSGIGSTNTINKENIIFSSKASRAPLNSDNAFTKSKKSLSSVVMSSHKQGVNQLANQVSISTKKESEPSDNKIDTVSNIAGTFTTIATSAVVARISHNQQSALKDPIEHAISRLDTNDPVQQKMAQALQEANLPNGIKGKLYPDAFVYNSEKTLTTRYKILSQDSVIGKKLARDLNKLVPSLKSMETIAKKAGIVGIIAGPVIGSATEVAKLNKNATTTDKITAGIVGGLKNVDNVVLGVGTGLVVGTSTLPSGPGAFVAGTAAGLAAESAYKESGYDAKFDHFIETTISPIIHGGVKFGVDSIESLNITIDKTIDELEETVDLILDIFD